MTSIHVAETSQIAEARRRAVHLAQTHGFDATAAGRVAIVATELATNLVKHGGGGELLLAPYGDGDGGIELIALDKGRGIVNIQQAMEDGYSTAGSAGHGLGAIKRQSQSTQFVSWAGLGTAIIARLTAKSQPSESESVTSGSVSVEMPGEIVCGDACAVAETPSGRTFLVADGLGHGPDAAIAATEAVRVFHRCSDQPLTTILEYLHNGLKPTRGAAVAVARIEIAKASVTFGGIGNIAGAVVHGTQIRRMVSLNGTAGHNARKIQTFEYALTDGQVIMHSDGIATSWSLDRYPGLTQQHPTLLAAVLYRDFSRRRDDATVLVGRRSAWN